MYARIIIVLSFVIMIDVPYCAIVICPEKQKSKVLNFHKPPRIKCVVFIRGYEVFLYNKRRDGIEYGRTFVRDEIILWWTLWTSIRVSKTIVEMATGQRLWYGGGILRTNTTLTSGKRSGIITHTNDTCTRAGPCNGGVKLTKQRVEGR